MSQSIDEWMERKKAKDYKNLFYENNSENLLGQLRDMRAMLDGLIRVIEQGGLPVARENSGE